MLKKLLDKKICSDCKKCCVFDIYDIWETPVFSEDIKNKTILLNPCAEFVPKDGGYIFKPNETSPDGSFRCPALSEKGCVLGDEKPFICKIFPYMIMELNNIKVITIASVCTEIYNRPLSELVSFLKDGLADKIFSYAETHPEITRPYNENYPILMIKK